jgi:hypothetical protein
MFVWGNVGLEALFNGDLERARAAFSEELRLGVELVDYRLAPEGLGGMAAVAAGREDDERAARLLGAGRAIGAIADDDVMLERHFFEAARRRYRAERWREAEAAGELLGFGEAIDLALAGCAESL